MTIQTFYSFCWLYAGLFLALNQKIMKSKFIVAALVMMLPFFADAQLKGLMNKVKNKVDQRIDNKVDKQIDKSLDEVEGKNDKDVASNGSTSTGTATETKVEEPGLKSFSKYDFVPG